MFTPETHTKLATQAYAWNRNLFIWFIFIAILECEHFEENDFDLSI